MKDIGKLVGWIACGICLAFMLAGDASAVIPANERAKPGETVTGVVTKAYRVNGKPRLHGSYSGRVYEMQIDGELYQFDGARKLGERVEFSREDVPFLRQVTESKSPKCSCDCNSGGKFGTYQISGDWVINTATGQLCRTEEAYASQQPPPAPPSKQELQEQ